MSEKKEKHRSFDISFKLRAIELAEKNTKEAAAREFDVDSKRIREWCKQKAKLQEQAHRTSKRKRLNGRDFVEKRLC